MEEIKRKIQSILQDYSQKSVIGWAVEEDDFERTSEEIAEKLFTDGKLKDSDRVHYEALQECCGNILKDVDSGKVPQRGIMGLKLLLPKY